MSRLSNAGPPPSQAPAAPLPRVGPRGRRPRRFGSAQAVGADVRTASIGGGCDANVFNRRGISSVNFGTGMRDIHTVNEWLSLDDFYRSAAIVVECVKLNAA